MLFDHEFRKLQAKEGLQWDDVNNSRRLAFFHLEKRQNKSAITNRRPGGQQVNAGSAPPRLRDSRGQQICINYNHGDSAISILQSTHWLLILILQARSQLFVTWMSGYTPTISAPSEIGFRGDTQPFANYKPSYSSSKRVGK